MYDDIASNRENPRPGVIINNPRGPDVYKGVPKVRSGWLHFLESTFKILVSVVLMRVFLFFFFFLEAGLYTGRC